MTLLLAPTPDVRRDLIRVGTTIRKPPEVVAAYLAGLAAQRPIPNTRLEYHFMLDQAPPETVALVQAFVAEHGGKVEEVPSDGTVDFADDHPVTHQWTPQAMARVGRIKNHILGTAYQDGAAAVWLCDADLMCDPGTLRSLWYVDQGIACAVYWTRWQPQADPLPQVWLTMPYGLRGQGYPDEAAFFRQLATRQPTRVWGQGACTLIRRRVLEKQVTFAYIPGVSQEGMMAGEDRHFCLRAEMTHLTQVADPWPHVFHVYHPGDRAKIPEYQDRLATLSVGKPQWLNLHCRLMEPVATGPGQMAHIPAIPIRGRVGAGHFLPDLERQALEHLDGEPFIAEVNYPRDYEIAPMRGQRRLLEVTVVDHKQDVPMPNLEGI